MALDIKYYRLPITDEILIDTVADKLENLQSQLRRQSDDKNISRKQQK